MFLVISNDLVLSSSHNSHLIYKHIGFPGFILAKTAKLRGLKDYFVLPNTKYVQSIVLIKSVTPIEY